MNAAFGNDLVDHHTYVLAGDGCLMEGICQEAIALAGHLKLNKLIVFWDNNDISIDGPVSLADNHRPGRRASRPPAGTPATSTATIRRRSPTPSKRARHSDKPTHDRLQDDHRLRRADQGRHQQGARLAARRRGDRRRPQVLQLGLSALRDAGRHPRRLARRPAKPAGKRDRLGEAPGRGRSEAARRIRAAHQRRAAGRLRRRDRRLQEEARRRQAEGRDPQIVARWRWRSSTAPCRRRSAAPPT